MKVKRYSSSTYYFDRYLGTVHQRGISYRLLVNCDLLRLFK